jgi:hypothetical protein
VGPNYALTINILYSPSLDIPQDYRFYNTNYGPRVLIKAHFRFRKKGPLLEVQGNKRTRLQPGKLTAVQSNIAGTKRKALPTET